MAIEFSVHKANGEDLETLQRLNFDLFEHEYVSGFSSTYNQEWTYSKEGKLWFQSILKDDDKQAWIAFNGQKIQVGFLVASIHDLKFRNPSLVGEIEMIYIEPEYRCSGIGRTLVETFKTWASERGCGILRVGALAKNSHAREFYEKWGFTESEIMYEITVQENS